MQVSQDEFLTEISHYISPLISPTRMLKVGIDGVDGAGKTSLADNLASFLQQMGHPVVRASVDGFHHPQEIRYRQGKDSPVGFYVDAYNYPALMQRLFTPMDRGEAFETCIFDYRMNRPVNACLQPFQASAFLLFDGIFLHRPELCSLWDFSMFLDVPFEISVPRGNARFAGAEIDPAHLSNRRYVEGQKLYLAQCQPQSKASLWIDYRQLTHPRIVSSNR